jgi:hypothetical protein
MGLSYEIVIIDRPHKLSFGHAGATVTKRGNSIRAAVVS